ncbi:MAG TPA: methyltransferase domain-containing protein [Gammaproteobacteria bacterium]
MALDDGYVNAEYLKRVAERARSLKQLSYERMAIKPGDIVLDAGCGPGVDLMALAERVGDDGKVIGIDSDNAMLDEAQRAVQQSTLAERIYYRLGSALALPLGDASVDSSRAERLLQVLPVEAERGVISELIRVTRPGGRIVLVDADWGSASVDFSDAELERRLMNFFATQMRPNGFAGRRIYALCHELALEDITLDIIPYIHLRFDETPFQDWLIDTALKVSVISRCEASAWRDELMERDADGRFVATVNIVIVSGRVPL